MVKSNFEHIYVFIDFHLLYFWIYIYPFFKYKYDTEGQFAKKEETNNSRTKMLSETHKQN